MAPTNLGYGQVGRQFFPAYNFLNDFLRREIKNLMILYSRTAKIILIPKILLDEIYELDDKINKLVIEG